MELFCAAIKIFSFSVEDSFRNHVQIFFHTIASVSRLKCLYICFSSHFCFLVCFFFSCYYLNRAIGLRSRVFTNGPGDRGSIPGRAITKTQKMLLDDALLCTQHYKIRIQRKVEQSREWSRALPFGVVAIEKGAFGSLSTKVTIFISLLLFTRWEFFTSTLPYGLSQRFEWQQVSSSFQDS